MTYITIGKITIPAVWLAAVIGIFTIALLYRLISRKRIGDWYWNSFIFYLLTWKLTYIPLNFSLFLDTPLSIVYFNGGRIGHILGLVVVSLYLLLYVRKKYGFSFTNKAQIFILIKKMIPIAILLLAIGIVIVNFVNAQKEAKDAVMQEQIEKNPSKEEPKKSELVVKEGHPAVDFTMTTLAGGSVKLSDYKGKKVILNFWATWCPPCKAEMPHMQNFYENRQDEEVEILAVNLTHMDNGYDEIERFVEEYGLSFPVLLDKNGKLSAKYKAFTIPTTYFIDSNGIISKKIVGPIDKRMIENILNELD
ncbi:redoxin domain-containing protein [Robertmurraya andreesenii]|uniref:Peroxiredoxin n=1 Tax=Anoxybacillus andreesenii TaxID=1325932 RepID=A0ABT9V0R8_9BACL|nr:redoxin domain-containing protein [Robertmurraya andreesenii]MDQ0154539.1 peroxiredoxin [Robertmurraya andreesenii]